MTEITGGHCPGAFLRRNSIRDETAESAVASTTRFERSRRHALGQDDGLRRPDCCADRLIPANHVEPRRQYFRLGPADLGVGVGLAHQDAGGYHVLVEDTDACSSRPYAVFGDRRAEGAATEDKDSPSIHRGR